MPVALRAGATGAAGAVVNGALGRALRLPATPDGPAQRGVGCEAGAQGTA
jgi:hypothetical protein